MDVLMLPEDDAAMEVMDASNNNEDEEERRRKRQKKKKTNRPPLCTFVNYLGPPVAAKPTPSPTATAPATVSEPTSRAEDDIEEDNGEEDKPMEDTCMAEQQDRYPTTDDRDDDGILLMKGVMVTTEPIETSPLSNDRDVIEDVVPTVPTIPSTTKFLLNTTTNGGGGDDNDSVETVNTSNKSVDVYLRPDSSFDNTPAVERWMKPPPSAPIAKDMLEKLDGLYVTSRSESDEEEEEPPRPLPEIVVKTRRHRLPSLHSQWRTKHSKRYCLG